MTDTNSLRRIESLFDQALEIPAEQRDRWLEAVCQGDAGLAATLREMLHFDQRAQTDLARGIGRLADDALEPGDRSGERIDRYRLISRIRFGGMAEVYAAVRDDGEFSHEVALKITRSDHGSTTELARLFQTERGLLARLRHPNICQIFDGGTTANGEAWFVMERLRGENLLDACRLLGWQEVLAHFLDLCAAVLHTHRQLIVHRDIKPDNVLLAESPRGLSVKLLDFGIAGSIATNDRRAEPTDHWYSANYSAPEVREGETGGISADIYSLGRLLARLAPRFPQSRRSDIEQIAARAAATDPGQRYADVEQLGEDLRRVRDRRPISLRCTQPGYVLHRFVQRRAAVLLGTVAIMLAISAFLINERRLRHESEVATAIAVAQRDRANRIRDFMVEAYESADPGSNAGNYPTVAELLDGQLESLENDARIDVQTRAALFGTLGQALLNLGRFDQADRALQQASALDLEHTDPDIAQWALHYTLYGQSAQRDNRFDDAEARFRAVEARRDVWGDTERAALIESRLFSSWGPLAFRLGRVEQAERMIRAGLEARRRWSKSQGVPEESSSLLVTLGAVQDAQGRLPEAQATFEQAYRTHRAAGHAFTFSHLALLGWLGIVLDKQGDAGAAEPYLLEAIEVAERLFPEPHARLSGAYGNLGAMLLKNGRLAEAEPYLTRGLDVARQLDDRASTAYQSRLHNVGMLALAREDLAGARPLLQENLALRRAGFGDDHLRTAYARTAIASLDVLEGRYAEAVEETARAIRIFESAGREIELASTLHFAALAHARQGQPAQAQALLQQAQALLMAHPDREREQAEAALARGRILRALGQADAAASAFDDAVRRFDAAFPAGHPDRARAQVELARHCIDRNDRECARQALESAAPLLESNLMRSGPTRLAWERAMALLN